MKYLFLSLFTLFSFSILTSQSSPIGVWQAIDDKDGEPSSHIEIYEVDGKLNGKIIKLIGEEDDIVCEKCKDEKKNQPVLGMEIMWKMKPHKENEWKGGKIMDPENGKEYKCKLKLAEEGVLEVRGYIGFSLLGRTQKWFRYTEEN
ncbi:MAG: DUF2147 domain-containing protein [Saprospiraceae bacterium]|nr:DUF2147 domain-containing protein [Saprospiraceae bacterium]